MPKEDFKASNDESITNIISDEDFLKSDVFSAILKQQSLEIPDSKYKTILSIIAHVGYHLNY